MTPARTSKSARWQLRETSADRASALPSMVAMSQAEYETFLATRGEVTIEGKSLRLLGRQRPKVLQPLDFKLETTTLWSFPKRGAWATHKASYRGNWAPQIARNIILRYSQPGDLVLDQMVGGGTTLVECKLTGRSAIGVDVNRDALMLTWDRLNFPLAPEGRQARLMEQGGTYAVPAARSGESEQALPSSGPAAPLQGSEPAVRLYQGDARNLDLISDASVDLIATHPPYANIIRYSKQAAESIANDLSNVRDIASYVVEMRRVAGECYRVLKPDHYCAVLMGDTRRNRHYAPIALRVMQAFLQAGFILKEDIIKAQWNTMTEGLWANLSRQKNFLLIMHEHLFIFRKPAPGEELRPFAESMNW